MKNKLTKVLAGMFLSVSIFSAVFAPTSAHAATTTTTTTTTSATIASAKADKVIQTAKKYLGTPYRYGSAMGQTNTFDCSSLTKFAFAQVGINLPKSSKAQSTVGTYVPRSQLKPGDLIFFYSPIHHVGIYIGNGKFIHTWGAPGVVINDLNASWWSRNYTTARREIQ